MLLAEFNAVPRVLGVFVFHSWLERTLRHVCGLPLLHYQRVLASVALHANAAHVEGSAAILHFIHAPLEGAFQRKCSVCRWTSLAWPPPGCK